MAGQHVVGETPASGKEPPPSRAGGADTLEMAESDRRWAIEHSRTRPHVPGYQTLEKLGAGAFGEVWAAREISTQAPVAIKFFRHTSGWQRLHEEIKQLAVLQGDPNIIYVKDVASPDEKGRPYYIMRRAERSLADRIEQGTLSIPEALAYFKQIVRAMVFVHAKGIRHCDLKPGNILLEADGRALVADFGQAHLSHDDSPALGTLFYMAPEQATLAEQIPDTAWDVYALGALFYAMIMGRPPHAEDHVRQELDSTDETGKKLELYRKLVAKSSRPEAHRQLPGMDRELAAIIDGCLEVDARRRYPDARAVQFALERRERRLRQRPWLAFALAAPLALVLMIAWASRWSALDAVEHSRRHLLDQLMESDRAAARLVAEAVDQRLLTRQRYLEEALVKKDAFADVPTRLLLADALTSGNRRELQELAERFHKERDDDFFRWSILDERGIMRASAGDVVDEQHRRETEELIDNNDASFAYRGWFNGTIDRYEDQGKSFSPLAAPHISHPYYGKVNQTGVICFSSPIKDAEGRTAGVLAAQVTVKELARWVEDVDISRGCVVLANERGYCVYHPDPNKPGEPLEPELDRLPRVMDCDPVRALIGRAAHEESPEWSTTPQGYSDPLAGGEVYLAAMKVLPGSKWVAIVQHELSAVEQPVDELRSVLAQGGWTLVGTSLALILGLWGCLFTWLRREERTEHV